MKLFILAAGEGSRLKSVSSEKPLARLFGLTLLERAVRTAEKAGISDIYIVTGFNAEKIEDQVRKSGLNVKLIYNPNWKKGNGSSLLAAKPLAENESEFLVAMADHISDGKILELLKNQKLNGCAALLAVDTSFPEFVDLEDATKVRFDKETKEILKAGKELGEFNGIDTGFFKFSPEIFKALERTESDGSLTAALNYLASRKKARALPVENAFWIDVDTPEALKKAKKIILINLTKKTDGPVSKFINRRISIPISSALSNTGVTPNQISVISFAVSLLAAYLFSLGSATTNLLGGVLAQISSIIDGCDGEVARLKLEESEFGGWFDAVLDRAADGLLFFGMSLGLLKSGFSQKAALFSFFLATIGSYLLSYTADKYDYLIKKGEVKTLRLGRDLRLFLIFLAGLLNKVFAFMVLIGALSIAEVVRRIWIAYLFSRKAA